jgi:hypothetical protein
MLTVEKFPMKPYLRLAAPAARREETTPVGHPHDRIIVTDPKLMRALGSR